METADSKDPFDNYIADACQVVNIYFVYSKDDIGKKKNPVKPYVTNQIFGQSEKIFGYLNLKISLYFLPISMECYLEILHDKCYSNVDEKIKPDNMEELIKPWIPSNTCNDKEQFINLMEAQDGSKMFGTVLKEFEHASSRADNKVSKYIITNCSTEEPGFTEFHEKFQCLIVWFIEAASYIDMQDPRWMYFYLYEETESCEGKTVKYPVGFCTVYKFFAYPDKTRTRISQFFILPPYQRMGLGTKLLQTVYKAINSLSGVSDITVEEPNEKFTRMRDYADALLLVHLPEFSAPMVRAGFTKQMAEAANKNFLINKTQAKHIFDILSLYYTTYGNNTSDIQNFTKDIKDILNAPYNAAHNK